MRASLTAFFWTECRVEVIFSQRSKNKEGFNCGPWFITTFKGPVLRQSIMYFPWDKFINEWAAEFLYVKWSREPPATKANNILMKKLFFRSCEEQFKLLAKMMRALESPGNGHKDELTPKQYMEVAQEYCVKGVDLFGAKFIAFYEVIHVDEVPNQLQPCGNTFNSICQALWKH